MSIGIALIIPDGVILVADGRRRHPQSLDPRAGIKDNIDKITSLNDHVFTVPFGVVQVTDPATAILKGSIKKDSSPERIRNNTDMSVKLIWNQFLGVLATDVDINHPTMRAALIVGGISQEEAFLAASLHGTGVNQKPLLLKDIFRFIVLGGEQHQADTHFAQQLQPIVKKQSWNFSEGPQNICTRKILQAANNTIQYLAELDNSIGGTVRYVIIRKGFPVKKEIYSSGSKGNI